MEQLTTYRCQGKEIGLIFLFKYDLNGNLRHFEIQEGQLNETQILWLFAAFVTSKTQENEPNFPATELMMQNEWMKKEKYLKVFEISKAAADLSFDALWELYNYKINKFHATKAFKKLKEETIIKLFLSIPKYHAYLATKPKLDQAHLATYINGQYYENDYPVISKNTNPVLHNLAKNLTHKVNSHG